jgi:predicted DNA-binding protein YlxM (UPF0122 family)
MFESSAKWIIYDKKTGKQLSPSKSWVKWQGAKMAAAKIGGNAEPADAAWYNDNKAKLLGEAVTPKKLDTEINTGPFDSKQKNSILSIIKMLPGKITDNSKATDVNGGGQLGVEIDGKAYIWFTMSALGHTGSVELKPASGKKRSTNSKDFKNIAGGSGQKALVAYVKELLSMNEATDLEEAIKVKTHRGMYSIKKGEESLKSWVEKIVIMSDAVKQKQRKTITQNIVKAIESGKIKNADLTQGLTALIGLDAPTDMEAPDRVVKSELKKLNLLESTDLEEGKIPSSNIAKFSSPQAAKRAASKQKYMTQVFMGDDDKFWVPSTNKEAGQLKKDGYEVYEAATWKSEGHYTADGKEWTGDQHEVDGQVMTGKVHTDDSVDLYHFKELSPEVRKQVAASFE